MFRKKSEFRWLMGGIFILTLFLPRHQGFAETEEGSATISPPDKIVAGSTTTIEIVFTAGPSGIPLGGGVAVGLHHLEAEWPGLTTVDASDPDAVAAATKLWTVKGKTANNFEIEWHPGWGFPEGVLEPSRFLTNEDDLMYHRLLIARVEKQAIKPGEKVVFTLGPIEVMPHAYVNHEFRIFTDSDGDGIYHPIKRSPMIDIIGADADHLVAVAPSQPLTAEPFQLFIKAEDPFFNLAQDYRGAVTVRDEQGQVLAKEVPVRQGIATITVSISEPGPQRLRLSDGELTGRSNPFRVLEEEPDYKIFWGDIHGHTKFSDGYGPGGDAYFTFARDISQLDVCALSDHGYAHWAETMRAVQGFYEPGHFVTILGWEWGTSWGHMNLYYREDEADPRLRFPKEEDSDKTIAHDGISIADFYDALAHTYDLQSETVMTGPHHLAYPVYPKEYPFSVWRPEVARFVEVHSVHGTSEFVDNPMTLGSKHAEQFMQYGLEKGLKFAVIGSGDAHDSHPGRSIKGNAPSGLVAFLAPELTREAIWEAWWDRRTYATCFDRVYMEFTINGLPMGSETVAEGKCKIEYYVIGRTDQVEVVLLRNNEEIRTDSTQEGNVSVSFEDNPPKGESFYYLRVIQSNGNRAWSTPIWVTKAGSQS